MTSVTEIHLSPGETLYREGDDNDSAYVIETGEVILYRTRDGKRINVERRGSGAIIGELSILTSQPRTVTVEALVASTVYRLSADRIRTRFDEIDPILRACIDTSINFSAAVTRGVADGSDEVALADSTLRNAGAVVEQFRLESDLVKGLQTGQVSLVYQPIVRLSDGAILGIEALSRWTHPQMGQVPPDRFVPVAETTGSIKMLTEFAILEACAALRRLRDLEGVAEDFFVSVNVSGQDIGRKGFVEFLAFVLDERDLPPEHIKLEITETALIPDFDVADRNFKHLQALGCGILIDDFGTGYSNFAYLRSLPITSLKIDRTFAGDAHANPVSRSIVELLITLGKDLGVDVIAEGLETEGDVETLRALGCQLAQGFFYHEPVSESALLPLISEAARGVDVA